MQLVLGTAAGIQVTRKQGKSRPDSKKTSVDSVDTIPGLVSPTDLAKAKGESDAIMKELPSSADDPRILPQIMAAVAGDTPVLVCKGDGGVSEAATSRTSKYQLMLVAGVAGSQLAEAQVDAPQQKPWRLQLNDVPSNCRGKSASNIFSDAVAMANFKCDMRSRIAQSMGVDVEKVSITDVKEGSIIVEYNIDDMTPEMQKYLVDTAVLIYARFKDELGAAFDSFEMPFVAVALEFNLDDLDHRGDRHSFEGSTYDIGPPGNTRPYKQPKGWVRYGLSVLGAFKGERWLCPFMDSQNWYRAFHGMRDPRRSAKSIFKNGFWPSGDDRHQGNTRAVHGKGVYCSPNADYAETYCGPLELQTETGKKQFLIAFQVAVEPGKQTEAKSDIWVVEDPQCVRPYGLLVKEA